VIQLIGGEEMPKYLVRKIFKYSENVEVEADSEEQVCDLAEKMDGERVHDDWLHDCKIIKQLSE
jgi:hypothetical protein